MNIYSIYNRHDVLCTIDTGDESLVAEEFGNETDINNIVNKYLRTGYIPPETVSKAFADVSNFDDYQGTLDKIKAAQDSFLELPSHVRARFANDPAQFMDFMQNLNHSTLEEALNLGLAVAENGKGNSSLLDVTVPTDTNEEKGE